MANDNDNLGKAIFGMVGGIVAVVFVCCIALDMTPYAESLIEYCMWYGKRSREDAIKLLDDNASPLWRLSCEPPRIDEVKTIQDSDDE